METGSGSPGNLATELRSDAATVTDSAKQRLHSEIDARKGGAAGQARTLASALSSASDELGQDSPSWLRSVFDTVSQTVGRLADTVEQKDSRELTQEVQQIAREHPGSFLAACAFAGFAAARVMQAGARGSTGSPDTGTGTALNTGMGTQQFSEAPSQPPAYPLAGTADPYVTAGPTGGGML
jgi:hypothetical protein